MQRTARMKRELDMLQKSPPHGISCWTVEDSIEHLEAQVIGNDDTPYAKGVFKLEVTVPERYPFEPPKVRFVTPIYHPNIDSAGRICLDILKMPPKGAWKPSLNISTVLTSVQLLMNEPNPEDPLMTEISDEFKYNKVLFLQHAKEWTQKHATQRQPILQSKENVTETTKESDDSDDQSEESSDEESCNKNAVFRKRVLPQENSGPCVKNGRF